jgi:hypothetical protein
MNEGSKRENDDGEEGNDQMTRLSMRFSRLKTGASV